MVRPRALPAGALPGGALPGGDGTLEWRGGPDLPAAVAVGLVAMAGAALSASVLAAGGGGGNLAAAGLGLALSVLALAAVAGELARDERIRVAGGAVEVSRRTLGGRSRWRESASAFEGLAPVDRRRRFFVRNAGRSATGRRGPVTEFVVVLRHARDRSRDLELFRAQPSLETLRAMHAMHAARSGSAAAAELEQVARGYRDALVRLAGALDLPVLATGAGGAPAPARVEELGIWLEPVPRDADPRGARSPGRVS